MWTAARSGQPLRILALRYPIKGVEYRLLLASDLTAPFEAVRRFGLVLLLSSPILIAAAATAGHWTAGRALAPVLAITKAARTIEAADLSRRIAVPESRDELRYLAETLNGILARIERSFRKTIEFTANASREAERNTTLLQDLLRLARADSGTAPLQMQRLDLAENVRQSGRVQRGFDGRQHQRLGADSARRGFNHTNSGPIIGDITSPLFGRANPSRWLAEL
jgi:signal transduction histidine kinase